MPFHASMVDNVYLVRWDGPVERDIGVMEQDVAHAVSRTRKRLHGLSIVPSSTQAPDDATRRAMGQSMPRLLEHLETMHVVIEGSGFRHTILRSAMSGIILVGGKRGRVFVHATAFDAAQKLASIAGSNARALETALGLAAALRHTV